MKASRAIRKNPFFSKRNNRKVLFCLGKAKRLFLINDFRRWYDRNYKNYYVFLIIILLFITICNKYKNSKIEETVIVVNLKSTVLCTYLHGANILSLFYFCDKAISVNFVPRVWVAIERSPQKKKTIPNREVSL